MKLTPDKSTVEIVVAVIAFTLVLLLLGVTIFGLNP